MFVAGAARAWNASALDETTLAHVLSRDVFEDETGLMGQAALQLGFVHQKLGVRAANETPLGTVIAAPKPAERELFCRNGRKWFSQIPRSRILEALAAIQEQRARIHRSECISDRGLLLAVELDLAARMAAQSCKFMLWQQAVAAGRTSTAKVLARAGIRELQHLERDFNEYWPLRNKAGPEHCTPFLRWRIDDYSR